MVAVEDVDQDRNGLVYHSEVEVVVEEVPHLKHLVRVPFPQVLKREVLLANPVEIL